MAAVTPGPQLVNRRNRGSGVEDDANQVSFYDDGAPSLRDEVPGCLLLLDGERVLES